MWIEKRNGKLRLYERYTALDGSVRRISVVLDKDTPQARNKAKIKLDERISNELSKVKDYNLSTLLTAYVIAKSKEVKASTTRRNERESNTLLKIIGDVKISSLTAGSVKRKIVNHNPKPSTVNEHIQRFKEIIKWGFQNDYIHDISWLDKLTKMHDIPKREKIKDKFIESSECQMLIDAMNDKWKYLVKFLLLSCLRTGEALALSNSDIDISERYIHVYKNKDNVTGEISSPKTYSSNREVYMQDDLLELCIEILERNKDSNSEYFFHGCEYYAFNKYLKTVSKKVIGRAITPHVLRHSHASLLAESYDYSFISRRLGHQNSRITKDIYIHITKAREERENNLLKEAHLF